MRLTARPIINESSSNSNLSSGHFGHISVTISQDVTMLAEVRQRLEYEQKLREYYSNYSPAEGIQTGAILGTALFLCFAYVIYKSKCKNKTELYEETVIRRSRMDTRINSLRKRSKRDHNIEEKTEEYVKPAVVLQPLQGHRKFRTDAPHNNMLSNFNGSVKTKEWLLNEVVVPCHLATCSRLCQSEMHFPDTTTAFSNSGHLQHDANVRRKFYGAVATLPESEEAYSDPLLPVRDLIANRVLPVHSARQQSSRDSPSRSTGTPENNPIFCIMPDRVKALENLPESSLIKESTSLTIC